MSRIGGQSIIWPPNENINHKKIFFFHISSRLQRKDFLFYLKPDFLKYGWKYLKNDKKHANSENFLYKAKILFNTTKISLIWQNFSSICKKKIQYDKKIFFDTAKIYSIKNFWLNFFSDGKFWICPPSIMNPTARPC